MDTPTLTQEQIDEANAELSRLFLNVASATKELGEFVTALAEKYPGIHVNKELCRMMLSELTEIGKMLEGA